MTAFATKPRYTIKDGTVMPNEIITAPNRFGVPAHLQGETKEGWGNIDENQRLLPRVKLLQATSPECATYPGEAIPGEFWHTSLTQTLGNEVIGVPIVRRQSYTLWTPKGVPGQEGGVLARARDGHHWDPPDGVFNVRFPNNPRVYTWKTARTVKESGLDQFGSSMSDDPKSKPAATLVFETLWWLPDFGILALTLNSRGSVMEARRLYAMVDAKPVNPYGQRYRICAQRKQGPSGESYFTYVYKGDGWADMETVAITKPLFQHWKDVGFEYQDEAQEDDEAVSPSSPRPSSAGPASSPRMGGAGVVDDDIPF